MDLNTIDLARYAVQFTSNVTWWVLPLLQLPTYHSESLHACLKTDQQKMILKQILTWLSSKFITFWRANLWQIYTPTKKQHTSARERYLIMKKEKKTFNIFVSSTKCQSVPCYILANSKHNWMLYTPHCIGLTSLHQHY